MAIDRMQTSRFELKYLVSEDAALRIRDFVRGYLDLDEYSACQPNLSYPVHSLYLDSEDLLTYWETINGTKNRFKLRLRYYSLDANSPVFFEIKRRMNNCILKQRGGVRQSMPPQFSCDDFIHLPALAKKLLDPANPAGKFLLARLASETRSMLAVCGNGGQDAELRQRLAKDFNAVLAGPALNECPGFPAVKSRAVERFLKNDSNGVLSNERLNRILIEETFQGEISQWIENPVEFLLRGNYPRRDFLVSRTEKAFVALQRFNEYLHAIRAAPRVHIAYEREAYVNENDTVRVTLDRNVRATPNTAFTPKMEMDDPQYSYRPMVILELKFTDRFPNWFRELVRVFNVMQRGAAKYVSSIQAIGTCPRYGIRAIGAITPVVLEESFNDVD